MCARLLVLCVLMGVAACESAPASHTLAMMMVGASGGQVALADGTSVTIPAGALTGDETITISTATTTASDAVGPAYTFGPEGLKFASAATIALPYTSSGHATVIVTAPANGTVFTALPTSDIDATHESAPTMHFSTFVVASGAFDAGGDLAESDLAALHDAGLIDASMHDAAAPDASALGDASTHGDAFTMNDASTQADASTHGDASTLVDASTHADASVLADASTQPDAATVTDAATASDAALAVDAATPSDAFASFDFSAPSDAAMPGDGAVACVPVTAPPTLPSGQNITFTVTTSAGVSTVTQDTSPSTMLNSWDDRSSTATLDASAYVDPAACQGGTLSFHWIVFNSTGVPVPDAGITGYDTPTLSVAANAMPTGSYSIDLSITSSASGLSTQYALPTRVTASQLSLSMYDTCQAQTNACASCACTFATALPSTEPM